MKMHLKLSAMLLLVSAFALTSCNDDKNDDGYPKLPAKNLVATAGDAQVVLTWAAPASDNLKEYNVTWTPGNGSAVVKKGTLTYTATGLENDKEYTFSVYAVYEAGKSDAVTTKATPKASAVNYPAVTELKAVGGDKAIALSWTKPAATDKVTLSGYTVSVSPGETDDITLGADATSYEITGLTNGTTYTVKVVADYSDKGKSPEATATATPTGAIAAVAIESPAGGAAYLDGEAYKIVAYYTTPADLSEVVLNITPAEGVTIETPQTFDLSEGKTGTIKISDEVSYTVEGKVDLLITAVEAKYDTKTATVNINQNDRSISIDFGQEEIDKKTITVGMTLSETATLVSPKDNPATMDLSKEAKIQLKDEYEQAVEYTVTCTGQQIVPAFNPTDITGVAIPADWTRVYSYNGKDLPKTMAVYHITQYNAEDINAYVIMWGRESAFSVYSDAGEKKPFADYRGLSSADAPAVLIAGDSSADCYIEHNSELLHYRPGALDYTTDPQYTCPTFALNADGTWQQASALAITENGTPVLANWDTGQKKWDAKEAFGCGGLYLNPAAGGGFTSNGSTKLQGQCFFGVNAPDSQIAAFFVCNHTDAVNGIIQDDVCKLLISVGIKYGFPVTKSTAVGLDINGEEVFASESTPRFAVGIK